MIGNLAERGDNMTKKVRVKPTPLTNASVAARAAELKNLIMEEIYFLYGKKHMATIAAWFELNCKVSNLGWLQCEKIILERIFEMMQKSIKLEGK